MTIKDIWRFAKRYVKNNNKKTILIVLGWALISSYIVGVVGQVLYHLLHNEIVVTYNIFYCIYYGLIDCIWTIILTLVLTYITFFVLCGITAVERDERGVVRAETGEHGTNHPMTVKEAAAIFKIDSIKNTKKNILGILEDGRVVSYDPYIPLNQKNDHKLVCAASGRGKSRGSVIPDIYQTIRRGESYVVIDSSGEIHDYTINVAKEFNYKIRVLNIRDCILGDGFELMQLFENDIGNPVTVAQKMTQIIVSNTITEVDFWSSVAEDTLVTGLVYIYEESKAGLCKRNMVEVYNLFAGNSIQDLIRIFEKLPPKHLAKMSSLSFVNAPKNIQEPARFGVANMLRTLLDQDMQNMFSHDEISLTAPGLEKCGYYLEVPDQDRSRSWIASMFIGGLILSLVEGVCLHKKGSNKKLDVPVNLILDEFTNTIRIPDWKEKMSTLRKYAVNVTMITQNIPGMVDIWKDQTAYSVMDACDIKLFMGTNDRQFTAAFFSDESGDETVVTEMEGIEQGAVVKKFTNSYNERKSLQKRAVYTPGEIKTLEDGKVIIFFGNKNPFMCNRFDISMHPMYKIYEEHKGENQLEDYIPRYLKKKVQYGQNPTLLEPDTAIKPFIEKPMDGTVAQGISKKTSGKSEDAYVVQDSQEKKVSGKTGFLSEEDADELFEADKNDIKKF